MAGVEQGSVHVEVALSRLQPGASVFGHRHFYEESFYILSGEVLVDIDGDAGEGDLAAVSPVLPDTPVALSSSSAGPGTKALASNP